MKLVQRGNRQLRVADDRLEDMRKAGYVELDPKTGKPVEVPAEPDAAALKKELAALRKENKELRAQLSELAKKPEG